MVLNKLNCQAVIVGAGPYGLAAAAHLRATGVETQVFGKVMEFWEQNMPEGMFLRSPWDASHIAHPGQVFTLDDYQSERGEKIPDPMPLPNFINYGKWFQRQAVGNIDPR